MAAKTLESHTMERKAQKTTPVRLSEDAIRWARIASGYTGESMAEYVSRIVIERGRQDADRLHSEVRPEIDQQEGGKRARDKKGEEQAN